MAKVDLLIVAPRSGFTHHVPAGFIFADEVFTEAELKDPLSNQETLTYDLQRALSYLAKRYPHRIRVQWVELWSLGGVWLVFRYRIRAFPAVIVNQKELLHDDRLKFQNFIEYIGALLSQAEGSAL